jgi:ElaB/YqjD/DUF883 family membrane-anchored ribosome-binding protein
MAINRQTRDATAQDAAQNLGNDLNAAAQDAETLVNQETQDLAAQASAFGANLANSMEAAREGFHELEEKVVQGAKAADAAIRQNPYPALGIAFAVGLIAGMFMNRK